MDILSNIDWNKLSEILSYDPKSPMIFCSGLFLFLFLGVSLIYLLLQRNQEFIDYNINVMNQTSADVTYTPPGAANLQALRQKKMFDTSI